MSKLNLLIKPVLFSCVVLLSACSASRMTCESWRENGQVLSTLDSCQQCLKTLGTKDPQVISGCALGLDAAALLSQ